MKNLKMLLSASCLLGMMWACTDTSNVTLDPAERDAKVDSIVKARTVEIKDSAQQACNARLETELTATVDSIINSILTNASK